MPEHDKHEKHEKEENPPAPRPGTDAGPDPGTDADTDAAPDTDAPAAPTDAVADVKTEQKTEQKAEEDAEEMADRWRRAMADLANQRKRHVRELEREREAERARVAGAWLPVIDHLELALAHAESDPGSLAEGVRAIRDQAIEVLRKLGYPRHDETGVPFDPALHEVVTAVDDPVAAPGTVVGVLRAGYGEPGRQLRPAAVAVSKQE